MIEDQLKLITHNKVEYGICTKKNLSKGTRRIEFS